MGGMVSIAIKQNHCSHGVYIPVGEMLRQTCLMGLRKTKLGKGIEIKEKGGWGYFTYGVRGIPLIRGHLSRDLKNSIEEPSLYVSVMWNALTYYQTVWLFFHLYISYLLQYVFKILKGSSLPLTLINFAPPSCCFTCGHLMNICP